VAHGAILLKEDFSLRGITRGRVLCCGVCSNAKTGKNHAHEKRPVE
jgi:hypothetical protein